MVRACGVPFRLPPVNADVRAQLRAAYFPSEVPFVGLLLVVGAAPALVLAWKSGAFAWLAGYAIGLSLLCYVLLILRRAMTVAGWPITAGQVVSCSFEEIPPGEGQPKTEYRPKIVYEYSDGLRVRRSEQFGVSVDAFRTSDQNEVQALAATYAPGTAVDVRISPHDPTWTFLRHDLPRRQRQHLQGVFAGGLLTVCAFAAAGYLQG